MESLANVIADWSIQVELVEDLIHESVLYKFLNEEDNEE